MGLSASVRAAVEPSRLAGDQLVEFYETQEFLVDTFSGFAAPALRGGDAVIVVATPAHRLAFDAALVGGGIDVASAIADGRYLAVDAADLLTGFMVEGVPDAARFDASIGRTIARASGGNRRSVRIFTEMVALLSGDRDFASGVAVGDLWNDLATRHDFALLCAYPMQAFEDEACTTAFRRICDQHTTVIPSEGYSLVDGADGQQRAVARLQQETVTLRADIARLRIAQAAATNEPAPAPDDEPTYQTVNRDRAAAGRDRAARDRDRQASDRDRSQVRADERTSNRAQAAADRDHAAADRDQTATDRDRSQARADQRTSTREQAAADRDQTASAGPDSATSASDRTRARFDRFRASTDRDQSLAQANQRTSNRGHAAADRGWTASDRDEAHAAADQRTSNRHQAAVDRDHTAADSAQTADDRVRSQAEAVQRTSDRTQAVVDREWAAADRAEAAADRAAAMRDRERARVALRRAQLDPLTGAFGRELGLVALEREIDRARRGNGRLALAYVDVDGLKQVNDSQGHAAGDALLRDVVEAIHQHLRSYDPTVRVGGDEFVCAMGDTTVGEARSRFEQISATLGRDAAISVGFAELRPRDTLAALTERGDEALYAAKRRR